MDPRHVPPGTEVSYTTADGTTKTIRSTELRKGYHYIEPMDAAGEAALTSLGYGVVRKAIEQTKSDDETPSEPETAPETAETDAPETAPETAETDAPTDTAGPGASKGDE